jgi:lantibiotic modifying enzyme
VILPPSLRKRAVKAVEEIARNLEELSRSSSAGSLGPSLRDGFAGLSLFFAYLEQGGTAGSNGQIAAELLDRAMTEMASVSADPGLFNGFLGVAWTVEHLQDQLIDKDIEDPGEEVASFICEYLSRSPDLRDFSLLKGLSGLGVYAIERSGRRFGRECLQQVVSRLTETAEHHSGGMAWRTPQEQLLKKVQPRYSLGHFNLGMALGIPGVVAVLSQAYGLGFGSRDLLESAAAWLLARRLPEGGHSIFPYTFSETDAPSGDQLAWCYGDLGVSVGLLAVARAVENSLWEREAIDIAKLSAARPIPKVRALDACLCHGASGIAHLFNRLFHATGALELKMAAIHWFERTLDLGMSGDSLGHYLFLGSDEAGGTGWREDPGFLTGSAGVGLALLAAATPVEPKWDCVLQVNVPLRQ